MFIYCLSFLNGGNYTQMKTVEFVDLERFMGDWYVIANIPTFIEKRATNAIESYELMDDGETIKTTFSFFNDSPDGKKKVYNPTGFVYNSETNAEWRMQFIWPFKSAFLIIDLDEGYNYTVIGIPSKKYVWIMAREPAISEQVYKTIIQNLSEIGYNTSLIRKVPQVWK